MLYTKLSVKNVGQIKNYIKDRIWTHKKTCNYLYQDNRKLIYWYNKIFIQTFNLYILFEYKKATGRLTKPRKWN